MKKFIVLLIFTLLSTSILVFAQNDGETFAHAMELFNAKSYDSAVEEFLKIPEGSQYHSSALYMAGACYNMKYSDVAMEKGASMTKGEIKQGIADLEKAEIYYGKACAAGYQQGCTQAKIIKQVIISMQPYAK